MAAPTPAANPQAQLSQHLIRSLSADVQPTSSLLSSLEAERCEPHQQPSPAQPRSHLQAKPLVLMLDLEAAAPSIQAYGMRWASAAVKQAEEEKMNDEDAAAASSSSSARSVDADSILFYSIESALFARPTNELLDYQQKVKQLPGALESNEAAMKAALETGEVSEVGALYIERIRLQAEYDKMKNAVPPSADLIEVRDTMLLKKGLNTIDGRHYFLLDRAATAAASESHPRQLEITDVHPKGAMKELPFADTERMKGSHILRQGMLPSLARMFGGELPKLTLLYSGRRDGYTAADFHRLCDRKGATLTVVQSRSTDSAVTYVFGGYNPHSWFSANAYSPGAGSWLFSLQSPTGLVTKLNHSSGSGPYNYKECGPVFGGGPDLLISNDMKSSSNYSSPSSYTRVAEGFSGTTFTELTMAGARDFVVDEIEVWKCE